jgi:hypothetical protein
VTRRERPDDPVQALQSLYLYNDREVSQLIDGNGGWIADLQRVERFADLPAQIRRTRSRLTELETSGGEPQRLRALRDELGKLEAVEGLSVMDRDALVEELYLRTVSRLPAVDEMQLAREVLESSESVSAGMRQLLWVLLNTKEFILNH